MSDAIQIKAHADSLISILAAQCADLESLLALARRERKAIEDADFESLLGIIGERAQLGNRLEIHHRCIAGLRKSLDNDDAAHHTQASHEYAANVTELINRIQTEDARTHKILTTTRAQLSCDHQRLANQQRYTNAYLRDARSVSVACDALC